MRRLILILSVLLSVAILATGCDFMRRVAGRPTAAEVQAKADTIEARRVAKERAIEKARRDSIAAVEKHRADSVLAADSLRRKGLRIMNTQKFGGPAIADLQNSYYIIVGSFTNFDNAQRCSQAYSDRGYDAQIIPLKNGYNVVGVCGTNDIVELNKSLGALRRQSFCPPKVWILTN